jgi:hypothetical protein
MFFLRKMSYFFLLAFLLFSGTGFAQQKECSLEASKKLPKAKTIAELAARYDSKACQECHPDQYEQWSKSLHSKSILGTPRTAPTIITAIDKGLKNFKCSGVKDDKDIQVKHLMFCMKCHLPQLEEATDDVAREIVATIRAWKKEEDDAKFNQLQEKIASLNIGCMVCHNLKAIIHKWEDGYPQPNTVYGSQAGEHEFKKIPKMAKAPAHGESIFCGQCHGTGPNFELDYPSQCATIYGSYLFAYIPEGGHESCQECHMKKSGLGHNMQAYRDETMIKMALNTHVDAQSLYWRKNKKDGVIPMGIVNVEIHNKAGHAIPDG